MDKLLNDGAVIGITGVTGKLGSYVAKIVAENGKKAVHLARTPEKAKVYDSAEIRKMSYANTDETIESLKGIDILLMVSAGENPNRVEEHTGFLDAAKAAGVKPLFMEQAMMLHLPCLEIMLRQRLILKN